MNEIAKDFGFQAPAYGPIALRAEHGESLPYTPSSNLAAGSVIIVGAFIYVTRADIYAGEQGEMYGPKRPLYDFPNGGNQSFTDHELAYWDPSAGSGNGALSNSAVQSGNANLSSIKLGPAVGSAEIALGPVTYGSVPTSAPVVVVALQP